MIIRLLTIKGAPEVLINRCTSITGDDGATRLFDHHTRAAIEEIKDQWSSQGRRVILLARKIVSQNAFRSSPSSNEFESEVSRLAMSGLNLVGIVGIIDRPVSRLTPLSFCFRREVLIYPSATKFPKWSEFLEELVFVYSW